MARSRLYLGSCPLRPQLKRLNLWTYAYVLSSFDADNGVKHSSSLVGKVIPKFKFE